MKEKIKLFFERAWIPLLLLGILPVYWSIALINEERVDYVNNGFFTFWLSGQMTWTEAHPYASADWVDGHHTNGATWIPNQIFPYPLPLALITAPLGVLPIKSAYILWELAAQLLIFSSIVWMSTRWEGLNRQLFAVVLVIAAVVNGNIYLGLMTGTIAALFLGFLTLGLFFLLRGQALAAGACVALMALKPPLMTIVILLGIWALFQRNWRFIGGMFAGSLFLLTLGLAQDPQWVQKFLGAGGNLFSMRLGHQPTIISYARLACGGDMTCAGAAYGLIAAGLTGVFAWLAWKNRARLTPLAAFSAAISLGALLPPYVWSYDYTLLVIPIVYVALEMVRRRETYVFAVIFLIIFDLVSIFGLTMFWLNPDSPALTVQRDMWSIWTGILALLASWWMVFGPAPTPKPDQAKI